MTRSLADWLAHLERLHPKTIDMGLERVRGVWARMAAGARPAFPLITVGGTNGKGSTCAFLECMLRRAGYRTASYTSPHLLRYNERVRLDGRAVDDARLCAAFEQVERQRADTALTFFEFGTLAAMQVFVEAGVDVAVLEVGLGGRLDAVNLFDADVAVITSIGIDHIEYLGPTRESIGHEKAGIYRAGRPAVCGDRDPPATLLAHAARIGARLLRAGVDYDVEAHERHWDYLSAERSRRGLPWPALTGRIQLSNAATAITALDALRERVPVDTGALRRALVEVELPGRFQVLPGRPCVILDVSHNPDAARHLAGNLAEQGRFGATLAVLGMLRDKDIDGVVRHLLPVVQAWFVATLGGPRGADAGRLRQSILAAAPQARVSAFDSPAEAFAAARAMAQPDDRIVALGSFLTVADILAHLQR